MNMETTSKLFIVLLVVFLAECSRLDQDGSEQGFHELDFQENLKNENRYKTKKKIEYKGNKMDTKLIEPGLLFKSMDKFLNYKWTYLEDYVHKKASSRARKVRQVRRPFGFRFNGGNTSIESFQKPTNHARNDVSEAMADTGGKLLSILNKFTHSRMYKFPTPLPDLEDFGG